MKIKKEFDFLVEDYGLEYLHQGFKNCYGGHWFIDTHSYYNKSGCFTIHDLPQRGEMDFFYAKRCSNIREELCEQDIRAVYPEFRRIEKEVYSDPYEELLTKSVNSWKFWKPLKIQNQYRDLMMKTLAETIKMMIERDGKFFGVKVK